MTFLPFNAETPAELAAIQKELDAIDSVHEDDPILGALGIPGLVMEAARSRLERDREAIYQADYDLSRQHRGY